MSSCTLSQKRDFINTVDAMPRRLRDVAGLVAAGLLSDKDLRPYLKLAQHYDIGISAHVCALIDNVKNPALDVIGRQYIPHKDELNIQPDEEEDPISDDAYTPVNGIVHRYPDRVLFKVSNVCAVYCRYCFRRDMIGAGSPHLSDGDFERAIDYIKTHTYIWEVILTGGDPLILSPRQLQKICDALKAIEHVQIIRIHTRIPVADPGKVNDGVLSVLKSTSKAMHVVLHVNHVKEITHDVKEAILKLRHANCSILSQSVLLKDVNDDAAILETLFRKLTTLHVKPYYLHHMDRAKGTSHFRVSMKKGMEIMKDLQGRVSGICLPKYMLDIPGGHGKIPVQGTYVQALNDCTYRVEDYQGCSHMYFDNVRED